MTSAQNIMLKIYQEKESTVLSLLRGEPHLINLDERCERGFTLLHASMHCYSTEVAKTLLSLGADINAKDNEGETPLHTLARQGSVNSEFAQFLIENGVNINTMNAYGETALDWAEKCHHDELIELLKKNGGTRGVKPESAPFIPAIIPADQLSEKDNSVLKNFYVRSLRDGTLREVSDQRSKALIEWVDRRPNLVQLVNHFNAITGTDEYNKAANAVIKEEKESHLRNKKSSAWFLAAPLHMAFNCVAGTLVTAITMTGVDVSGKHGYGFNKGHLLPYGVATAGAVTAQFLPALATYTPLAAGAIGFAGGIAVMGSGLGVLISSLLYAGIIKDQLLARDPEKGYQLAKKLNTFRDKISFWHKPQGPE